MGNDGYMFEEIYSLPSTHKRANRGCEQDYGSYVEEIYFQTSQNLGSELTVCLVCFNWAVHGYLGKTLFETCYGFLPPGPFDMVFSSDSTTAGKERSDRLAQRFLAKISLMHATVEVQLKKSQTKYKAKHDKHSVPCNFIRMVFG